MDNFWIDANTDRKDVHGQKNIVPSGTRGQQSPNQKILSMAKKNVRGHLFFVLGHFFCPSLYQNGVNNIVPIIVPGGKSWTQ